MYTNQEQTINGSHYCPRCGHLSNSSTNICPKCGTPLIHPGNSYGASGPSPRPMPSPSHSQSKGVLIGVLSTLIIIFLGIILYYFMSSRGQSEEAALKAKTDSMELEKEKLKVELAKINAQKDSISSVSVSPSSNTESTPSYQKNLSGSFIYPDGRSSPIKLKFNDVNGVVSNVRYTNVKYNVKLPMDGSYDGGTYHFYGHDGTDPFEIHISRSGSQYRGYAVVGYKNFDVVLQ